MAYTAEANYKEQVSCILGCTRCELAQTRTNIVLYRGNPRSDIMVIGEGPGREEDRAGKAMVGPTGSYLVDIFAKNGLDLYKYFITNAVLCRVPDNGDPSEEQMNACSEWLDLQIRLVNPKYIFAIGKHAASRLIPDFRLQNMKITKIQGEKFTPAHLRGAVVIAMTHPSYVRRGRALEEHYEKLFAEILEDVKKDIPF